MCGSFTQTNMESVPQASLSSSPPLPPAIWDKFTLKEWRTLYEVMLRDGDEEDPECINLDTFKHSFICEINGISDLEYRMFRFMEMMVNMGHCTVEDLEQL